MEKIPTLQNSTATIKINFANSSRESLYIWHVSISDDEKNVIETTLDEAEQEMFQQILNACDVGSSMLVLAGLRAIIDSLATKICVRQAIPIEIHRDGKWKPLSFRDRLSIIQEYFSDIQNYACFENLVNMANESLHELKLRLERKGSRKYVKRVLKILATERIFNS